MIGSRTCSSDLSSVSRPFFEGSGQGPLQDLSEVSADGYANGVREIHKFNENRLVTNFTAVDSSQNLSWGLKWKGKFFSFETYPPSEILEF